MRAIKISGGNAGSGNLRPVIFIIFFSIFCTIVFHDLVSRFYGKPPQDLQEIREFEEDDSDSDSDSFPVPPPPPQPRNELEEGLARARASIKRAVSLKNHSHNKNAIFYSGIYRDPAAFFRSYEEMEKRLKIYVYEEGEAPLVHDGPCKDIYSSEGRFIHEMENESNRFRTSDPHEAHLFFMPFSVVWMVKYLYVPDSHDMKPIRDFVSNYVGFISIRHPFWNRTQGADHFMVSCHDWGLEVSKGSAFLYTRSIRVLCNANTSEGFAPQKDVSLPEIALYGGHVNPKVNPNRPHEEDDGSIPKPYLAFFAGGNHGPIRPLLLNHWKDKDPELRVSEYLDQGEDYYEYMLRSKFCLCPSGHEVASPRIVEAIYAECVPVILSDHYVLPFSDVLRWEAFSISVNVSEIPRLKEILQGISEDEYRRLRIGTTNVRRHFVLNSPAKRYDMFSMILHSMWLRRLNMRVM